MCDTPPVGGPAVGSVTALQTGAGAATASPSGLWVPNLARVGAGTPPPRRRRAAPAAAAAASSAAAAAAAVGPATAAAVAADAASASTPLRQAG